ncbi:MAG: hypothetical protein WBX11_08870 [Thiobacillaceae bacterium]
MAGSIAMKQVTTEVVVGKSAGIVLLIIGVILGPGYYIYTRFYTGREITELPLEFSAGPDGRPVAIARFDLLPVMGPVTVILNLTISYGPTLTPPNTPRNRYRARITLNGTTILSQPFTLKATQVEATPAQVFKHSLPVMSIKTPGEYRLELAQDGEAEMEIKQASVQVRAGVHYLNTTLLAVGIVLLSAGVYVILI